MRVSTVAVCLLVGCSGGDLTLPDSAHPVTLRIVSGDGQRAVAGDLLAQPLVVQVLDSDANPVPDARVEFGFLGAVPGAAVDPGLVTTDAEGRAEAVVPTRQRDRRALDHRSGGRRRISRPQRALLGGGHELGWRWRRQEG